MLAINNSATRTRKYFLYIMLILAFVQIMDAYTTSYTAAFPSKVIQEFLIIPFGFDDNIAQAIMSFCIAIATIGMYVVFFNQFLADKLGRKKMLFITTLGMGGSALLLALSVNIYLYTIFLFCTYLFFSSDMWLIYANEESPAKKKAKYTNYLLAFGILGPIMMPLLRSIFITETSPIWWWRGMTLLPIILGIPLCFIIFFTVKETRIYEEAKLTEKVETSKIFLKTNIKSLFKSTKKREYIILIIMSFMTGLSFNVLQLAESFLNKNTILSESQVNLAITIIAIAVIIGYLFTGILADKIGRIPLLYLYSILIPISTIMLYIGSTLTGDTFFILSLAVALVYVGYNGLLIVIRIIVIETVPTDIRGTGMGIRALMTALGITVGFVLTGFITLISNLGIAFIILSIPVISHLFLIPKYIKETKGTDLSEVQIK